LYRRFAALTPVRVRATLPRVSTWSARVEWLLVAAGVALLLFFHFHDISADAIARYQALEGLLEGGVMPTTPYSMVGPIVSIPFYVLGRLYASPDWWLGRFTSMLLALALIVTYRLTRHEDAPIVRRFFLLILAASMFPHYVRGYGAEAVTALLVGVGFLAVQYGHALAGWTAVVIGVANTPASSVGLALASGMYAWRTRRLRQLAPVLAVAVVILLESWVRRGDPFVTGYEGNRGAETVLPYSGIPGFSYPFFFGVLSILFSFGKGLVFFAPGLLLWTRETAAGVSERLRAAQGFWIWFVAGLVLVYAQWWSWYGGWTWGPRFFLIASLPASLALAARLRRVTDASLGSLAATGLVLTLSSWVGISGAAFDQRTLEVCHENHYALESLCWYVPEFSALWRPFVSFSSPLVTQGVYGVYCAVVYLALMAPVATALARRIDAGRLVRQGLIGWRW
jgi:hypothetical protein